MSGNIFGTIFRVGTFGESHGKAIGVLIDGCPAGIPIHIDDIQAELNRRRPGARHKVDGADTGLSASHKDEPRANPAVTARNEEDKARILSGVFNGLSLGTPIVMGIENTDAHSADYEKTADRFRPGHADLTWLQKYGIRDYRGGGRASGRETAARVAAGAVARAVLKTAGNIDITAYTKEAAGISCPPFDSAPDKRIIEQTALKTADFDAAQKMEERIAELRVRGDSCGGIVECVISGVPAGWGEPVFDKLDAEFAKAVLSIGAVKGIEFGAGFAGCALTGSQWNDAMHVQNGEVRFETNNAGGILGGISNGNTIVFRAAVKPVPSIFIKQQTVQCARGADGRAPNFEDAELLIEGRHDVCLCPRIIPVIEAMAAICLADMYLRNKSARIPPIAGKAGGAQP